MAAAMADIGKNIGAATKVKGTRKVEGSSWLWPWEILRVKLRR